MAEVKNIVVEEKPAKTHSGGAVLLLSLLLYLLATGALILASIRLDADGWKQAGWLTLFIVCITYLCIGWLPWCGLKVIRPNEALVLTLFGKYVGTLKEDGFYYVNPFCSSASPASGRAWAGMQIGVNTNGETKAQAQIPGLSRKISLKAMTLDNKKQKINDAMGNPIEVGIIVIWKVVNTAKAVFQVDNYEQFVSIQADSALRDVVRQYPYDSTGEEMSLRESSSEIAEQLRQDLQTRVQVAGLEILEARITHLAYAPEIAAAMLQRQQASAIIDARQKIVDGAVGMVEMALNKLNENQICELDEERKAAMVSNLLVVLCGNKDAQPIVNSGSLY